MRWRVVLVLATLLASACGSTLTSISDAWDRAAAQSSLEPLLIDPTTLPASCALTWKAKPLFFEPTTTYPDDFLGFVIGQFWFPPASGVDLRAVILGVSNVYVSPTVDHAVVSVSLVFEALATAEKAEAYLTATFGSRPGFSVGRNQNVLSLFAPHPSVNQDCAGPLWRAIATDLERAA